MTSMTSTAVFVTGGVDTHGQTHHAAAIDQVGRQLPSELFVHSGASKRHMVNMPDAPTFAFGRHAL